MTWLETIIEALNQLGGKSKYKPLYTKIKEIAPDKVANNAHWRDAVRRTIEEFSSDSSFFAHRQDIFYSVDGIGKGNWGLRSQYLNYTNQEDNDIDSINQINRVNYMISRVIRDSQLVRYLKNIHNNTCQLCGARLKFNSNHYYSEGHHIRPLGRRHGGPDIAENIIILCPNCHTLCDYGAIYLNKNNIKMVSGHKISQEFIDYHNNYIYQNIE